MLEGVKAALGSVRAEVKGWASTDYAAALGLAAIGTYAEEAITSFFTRLTKLTGWKASAVKNAGRIAMSAIYYGLGRMVNPLVGITMATGPLLVLGVDIINWLVGTPPQELGERLALRALGGWVPPKAPKAMPATSVTVARAVATTSSTATHPAFT